MEFLGWILWFGAMVWTLVSVIILVMEIFFPKPYEPPFIPKAAKIIIAGTYSIGMVLILFVTVAYLKKIHLIWLAPTFHFFHMFIIVPLIMVMITKLSMSYTAINDHKEMLKQMNIQQILQKKSYPIKKDSPFFKYPLLSLYFDDFEDLWKALENRQIAIAKDELMPWGKWNLSIEDIARKHSLFLKLYDKDFIKILINDENEICIDEEKFYLEFLRNPEKIDEYVDEINNEYIKQLREEDRKIISENLELIKRRFADIEM